MSDGPLDQFLGYRDRLPMQWRPAAAAAPINGWSEQNLRVLAAIATLDERPRIDPDTEAAAEFERLHHKFDVMIDLLGALLRTHQQLPPPIPVRLSCEGLSWPVADQRPTVGMQLEVELYLHSCAPSPWRWQGELLAIHEGELCLRFAPLPAVLAAALDRHVFTRHRRSVADARSPAQSGDRLTAS